MKANDSNTTVGVRSRAATGERTRYREELTMRNRIGDWSQMASDIFETASSDYPEDSLTQWCIQEGTDLVLYTDAYLPGKKIGTSDEIFGGLREKLMVGTLKVSDLPYTRSLNELEDGLRLPLGARTRVIIFPTKDSGIRGVLLRRFRDGVIYGWGARINDDRFEAISTRAQLINRQMEQHEESEKHLEDRQQAKTTAAINFAAVVEALVAESSLDDEEKLEAFQTVDTFIEELGR